MLGKKSSSFVLLVVLIISGFIGHRGVHNSVLAVGNHEDDLCRSNGDQRESDDLVISGLGTDSEQLFDYDDSPEEGYSDKGDEDTDWENVDRDEGLFDDDGDVDEDEDEDSDEDEDEAGNFDVKGLSAGGNGDEENVGRDGAFTGEYGVEDPGKDYVADEEDEKGGSGVGNEDDIDTDDAVTVELLSVQKDKVSEDDGDPGGGEEVDPEDEYENREVHEDGDGDDWDGNEGEVGNADDNDNGSGDSDDPPVTVYGQAFFSHAEDESSEWEPLADGDNEKADSFDTVNTGLFGQAVLDRPGDQWDSTADGAFPQETDDEHREQEDVDAIKGQTVLTKGGEIHDPYLVEIDELEFGHSDMMGSEPDVENVHLVGQSVRHAVDGVHGEDVEDLFEDTVAAFDI